MNVIERFLPVNPYSRPGRRLADVKAVILHYVGVPNQRALSVWNYFAFDCPKNKRFASTQYIVDLNGDVYQTMPADEVAFHCGTSRADPQSGRVYTDWAREKFGRFASDPARNSPNNCTVGIELCIDGRGGFTGQTLGAATELVAKLLRDNGLALGDIGHHNLVVGWKDCPRPWVNNPSLFEDFKRGVMVQMRL